MPPRPLPTSVDAPRRRPPPPLRPPSAPRPSLCTEAVPRRSAELCHRLPPQNREKLVECMFETYGFDGVHCSIQAVLTLYAQGLLTGMPPCPPRPRPRPRPRRS